MFLSATLTHKNMVPANSTQKAVMHFDCSNCKQRPHCPAALLSPTELKEFSARCVTRRKAPKGTALFRVAEPMDSLFIIRLGSVKSTVLTDSGSEQITGFHMSGELLGAEGIPSGFHICTAEALEDSEICVLSYLKLQSVIEEFPKLSFHLARLLSEEIVNEHRNLLMLGSMNSTKRLASFLLTLSQRFEDRGFSRSEFVLRMTRAEIGSFLGLKLETVSRTLSRFTELNLIEIHQKHVHILDWEGLKALARDGSKIK